ncbi:MAG TPA: nucleotide exchange factor GrpE [Bacteroidales bacterium]|nr:nucleotide exchange factor GrpE [Bacteroidales bacterium]
MAKKSSRKVTDERDMNMENEAKATKAQQVEEQADVQEQDADTRATEEETDDIKKDECEKRLSDTQEKYLRLTAEFDNYRKRTLREKSELLKSASEDVLVKILPVMDDFERAIGSMEDSTDIDAIRAGIYLIYNKFKDFLKQQGIKEMNSINNEFDTDMHEAVTKIPVQEEENKGKVVDVIEKGYLLNDKVVRYAKVIIGE